ncbi:Eco57I restriction-modification methylase domain-containing protein [Helicobacter sp. T3_23-1059]
MLKAQSYLDFAKFDKISSELDKLYNEIDSLKDTSESEVAESKRIYHNEILPTLNKLNLYLNFFTAQKFATHSQAKAFSTLDSLENLVSEAQGDYKDAADFTRAKAKEFAFFNYEIEFPEIRNGKFNGFQAIVGNPPWDKTKFSDNDFFPQFKSDYRTLILSKKREFKTNQLDKNYIAREYEQKELFSQTINEYYKDNYPLSRGCSDLNLFRFFVERNLALLAPKASLNYVLPSALMLEDNSYNLRKEILTNYTLNLFYTFENREGIFNDVDSRYKFALMQVANAPTPKNHTIQTMFYKTNIDEIYKRENVIRLDLAQIRALSPAHLALQEVRSKRDLEILGKAYGKFAPLDSRYLDFRNELHMTADKDLFIEADCLPPHYRIFSHTHKLSYHTDSPLCHTEGEARSISNTKQQERYFANAQYDKENSPSLANFIPHPKSLPQGEGLALSSPSLARGDSKHSHSLAELSPFDSPSLAEGARGWVSLRESQRDSWQSAQYLPLFEGKMIHQFNAEFSPPNYFLDKDAFDNRLKSKEIYRLKQDLGIDNKEYTRLVESLYKSACHSERSEESQMSHKNRDILAFFKASI